MKRFFYTNNNTLVNRIFIMPNLIKVIERDNYFDAKNNITPGTTLESKLDNMNIGDICYCGKGSNTCDVTVIRLKDN